MKKSLFCLTFVVMVMMASCGPEITTMVSEKDDMVLVYVPEGDFLMGSNDTEIHDAQPQHTVYLDAFWIDQTEVTNGMYEKCVEAGACEPPSKTMSKTRDSYYGNSQYADYPVIFIDFYSAETYCEWVERRLPTEAEWEKAARGTDGQEYPWGEGIDSSLANYGDNVGDTTEVGSYPDGASPYGALDMAGNVEELVADRYEKDYYSSSPDAN